MYFWWIIFLFITTSNCLSKTEAADDEYDGHENESNKTMEVKNSTVFRTKYDRYFISRKKLIIVFTLLGISFVGAIILSFVNVNDDFNLLDTFYTGYLGRRLVIREQMEENRHVININNNNQVEYRQ